MRIESRGSSDLLPGLHAGNIGYGGAANRNGELYHKRFEVRGSRFGVRGSEFGVRLRWRVVFCYGGGEVKGMYVSALIGLAAFIVGMIIVHFTPEDDRRNPNASK
jgi:hypothetical protein